MRKAILILSLALIVFACNEIEVTKPEYEDGSILNGTLPLADSVKANMEGIYSIVDGGGNFGEQVAVVWKADKLIFYGKKDGTYFVLSAGEKNGKILLEGIWRHMRNVESGLTRLKISKDDVNKLLAGNSNITLDGSFAYGNSINSEKLKLRFERKISDEARNSNFLIVAHRGGVRNSDYIGVSENTIEMIALAEQLGANGIEIDVKLSKDNVPFLYHDSDINLRLVQEPPIWGPIEEFTFPQIQTFLVLVNGEKIPKLKDALEFVLERTNLRFVWLDMKSSKNAMPYVIPIQQEIMQRAEAEGRDLKIVIGLPAEDKYQNFINYPNHENILSLCELSPEQVRTANSYVWGPRWTLGTQDEIVSEMHNEGRIVVTWTIDQDEFIRKFLNEGNFDGFVTNYPTVVAYYNYVRQSK